MARAPARPPFGPAGLGEVFAFLEWRATEDVLGTPPKGSTFVHAAGVALQGRALLLVGRSGSGKSTVAAHLAAMGARLWGDDVLCFAPGPGEFAPFPRSLKLDDGALRQLEMLAGLAAAAAPGTFPAPPCCYVSPAAIRGDWAAPRGRPAMIATLEAGRHGAPLSVERMSEGEAAVQVGQALLLARADRPARWSEAMVQVIEALGDVVAYRVAGGPPRALASALARLLVP